MATLAAVLSTAVIGSLTKSLPAAVESKFQVPAAEFSAFLKSFLEEQFKVASKSKGKATGRVTGYNLFSKDARLKDKSLTFAKIGEMWKSLSKAQQDVWNAKAKEVNSESDGGDLPARKEEVPTDSEKEHSEDEAPAKKTAKKKAPAAPKDSDSEGEKPAQKKAAAPKVEIETDEATKKKVIKGTPFVVNDGRKKQVIGKLANGKVLPLSDSDRANCERNGWKVVEAVSDDDE